jgi:hypothetical protein
MNFPRLLIRSSVPLVLTISACESSNKDPASGPFDGVYVATSANGQNLPITGTAGAETRTLFADTLRFKSDQTVTEITVFQMVKPMPTAKGLGHFTLDYKLAGNKLTLTVPRSQCFSEATCPKPIDGQIDAARITFPHGTVMGAFSGALVFTRRIE